MLICQEDLELHEVKQGIIAACGRLPSDSVNLSLEMRVHAQPSPRAVGGGTVAQCSPPSEADDSPNSPTESNMVVAGPNEIQSDKEHVQPGTTIVPSGNKRQRTAPTRFHDSK